MAVEIRLLSEADVDAFWRLRLRALKEEPESFGASYEESVNLPQSDIVARLQNTDESFVFGAFTPELSGMIGFFRHKGLKARHKGTIWGMYVVPEARGQGIGRALMQASIERAITIFDLEYLTLTVVTTKTSARQLYSSLGFETYGLERAALKLGEQLFDEELMSLALQQRKDDQ